MKAKFVLKPEQIKSHHVDESLQIFGSAEDRKTTSLKMINLLCDNYYRKKLSFLGAARATALQRFIIELRANQWNIKKEKINECQWQLMCRKKRVHRKRLLKTCRMNINRLQVKSKRRQFDGCQELATDYIFGLKYTQWSYRAHEIGKLEQKD